MKPALAVFLVLLTMCASRPAAPPVTVVVTAAAEADRGDAARLQALTEKAIRSRGASAPCVVSVDYFGTATAYNVTPSVSQPYQLVFATFTISDPAGNVLHRESLRSKQTSGRLELLRDAAEVIAQRVRVIGS